MATSGGSMTFDPSNTPAGTTTTAKASAADPQTGAAGGPGTSGSERPRLVVFGGTGFVGTRVVEEGLRSGLAVVSITRSGQPPSAVSRKPWASQVQWSKGDVFNPLSWQSELEGAVGVVSTLGGFGSNDAMYKICGESNMSVMEAASKANVPRFAFISAHDFNFPEFFLTGYFKGKRAAEAKLQALFPSGGVALRPGFISGTRIVAGIGVPLQLVGAPLDRLLSLLPAQRLANWPVIGPAAVPPVTVEAVAKAAVAAITDPSVPPGVMDVWKIKADYET